MLEFLANCASGVVDVLLEFQRVRPSLRFLIVAVLITVAIVGWIAARGL